MNNKNNIVDEKSALRQMWQIRFVEEMIQELQNAGEIYGTTHLCIGQEATAVGGAGILKQTDLLVSTHRNHGHSIAKGIKIKALFAEILGKKTGTNGGKGGSMHIADVTMGHLGSNGIVGGGFPIAGGAALSAQLRETNQVVLCYAGDGATNEGSFHEALNLSSIWRLPIIFFIENNQYGMSSPIQEMVNISKLSDRAQSYGIEGVTIDGNDVLVVAKTVKKAVDKARKGEGPTLIEALTYRHNGHSKSDKLLYRTSEEYEHWITSNDPIHRLEAKLIAENQLTSTEIIILKKQLKKELTVLLQEAKKEAEPSMDELWAHVYSEVK